MKVVSGDTPDTLATLSAVYGSVVDAGIFEASGIRVAEATKVIENSQRDINIAFMNELAITSLADEKLSWKCKRGIDQMCADAWRWQRCDSAGKS